MAEKKSTSKKAKTPSTLVIVESPAKAHTIEKYLGPGYTVKASMGHLIDLPKAKSPLGTTLIGTSLLGEVIVNFALTVFGTISTSTILPLVLTLASSRVITTLPTVKVLVTLAVSVR